MKKTEKIYSDLRLTKVYCFGHFAIRIKYNMLTDILAQEQMA